MYDLLALRRGIFEGDSSLVPSYMRDVRVGDLVVKGIEVGIVVGEKKLSRATAVRYYCKVMVSGRIANWYIEDIDISETERLRIEWGLMDMDD